MPKISVATMEGAPTMDPSECDGETFEGDVRTLGLLAGPKHPLHARLHEMDRGARIAWPASEAGFLAYVWQGAFDVAGHRLGRGSMTIVEHHADLRAEAAEDGSSLLVFNATASAQERPGGHVHILPAENVPRTDQLVPYRDGVGGALLADAACPTCQFWLHENTFSEPGEEIALHSHSEDEIIVVTEGAIILGRRPCGPGTTIAIAAGTLYGFMAGPSGLSFINFRPKRPTYTAAGASNSIDEQAVFRARLGSPPYVPYSGDMT